MIVLFFKSDDYYSKVPFILQLQSNRCSLDLIGDLLFSVVFPPQYEYEEDHHGHQSHYGPQCSCYNHTSVGSWGKDHSLAFHSMSHRGVVFF